jgi:ATP-dependent RNA helicase DDX42
VRELRRELQVHVSGFDPPKPVQTFGQAGFDHLLLGAIKKAGYDKPTAIQAQALPAVLSGRDVLVRVHVMYGGSRQELQVSPLFQAPP